MNGNKVIVKPCFSFSSSFMHLNFDPLSASCSLRHVLSIQWPQGKHSLMCYPTKSPFHSASPHCFFPALSLTSVLRCFNSCPTLWDPKDCGLPGSSVPGALQARILKWIAMPGIFPTQGSNPRLLRLLQVGSLRLGQPEKPCFLFIVKQRPFWLNPGEARLQQYVNWELAEVETGFRKGRGTRDQITNIRWITEKKGISEKHLLCSADYAKAFDCLKVKVLVLQSGLTLCDPMDYSPPGSSVHGIFQARILEWIAIPFSRGSSWPRDRNWVSCIAGGFFTLWATSNCLDHNEHL